MAASDPGSNSQTSAISSAVSGEEAQDTDQPVGESGFGSVAASTISCVIAENRSFTPRLHVGLAGMIVITTLEPFCELTCMCSALLRVHPEVVLPSKH